VDLLEERVRCSRETLSTTQTARESLALVGKKKIQFMAMIIPTPQYKVAIHIRGAHPLGEQRTKEIFHAAEATAKLLCNKLTTTC